ncbi:hypothetical protein BC830DRAFT_1159576 [Chytriomyces sp. MP71]|nr:hypothetical protein BC830DRAFT_1159576 [Chytriomyces sp. MP71]
MAPPQRPPPLLRALPYILYLAVFAASAGVCAYYGPRLPATFVSRAGTSTSTSSQIALLLGISGGLFLLKFLPAVVYIVVPTKHKHGLLQQALPLNPNQKEFWLRQHPDEYHRIEEWLILDALCLGAPVAINLLGGFLLEFMDALSGDKAYTASKYWLVPHIIMVILFVPPLWFLYQHGRELFVNLEPVDVQSLTAYGQPAPMGMYQLQPVAVQPYQTQQGALYMQPAAEQYPAAQAQGAARYPTAYSN